MLRITWSGTRARLQRHGVPITKGTGLGPSSEIGGIVSERNEYGPAWAVAIAEGEPISEEMREWAFLEVTRNPGFLRALEAVTMLSKRPEIVAFITSAWVASSEEERELSPEIE